MTEDPAILHIPVGLPGCGKSTWAREFQRASDLLGHDFVIVSTDDIRRELAGTALNKFDATLADFWNLDPTPQDLVFEIFHADIFRGLRDGDTVVADATNLHGFARDRLVAIAKLLKVPIHARVWRNLSAARHRNRHREDKTAVVPEDAMARMEQQFAAAFLSVQTEDHYADLQWVEHD